MKREFKVVFDGQEARMTLDEIGANNHRNSLMDTRLTPAEMGVLDKAIQGAIYQVNAMRSAMTVEEREAWEQHEKQLDALIKVQTKKIQKAVIESKRTKSK